MIHPKHLVSNYVSLLIIPIYMYATDRKEGYVLRKLQRSLSVIQTGCEHWNIKKINADNTQTIYFSRRYRSREVHLTLNGRNILFVHHVKYLGVIFNKRIKWRLHVEVTDAKAFRTFIRIYSLFKRECLRAFIKLSLHKALIISVMTYACPACEVATDTYLLK
jgi:hypothetical protein